LPSYIFHWNCPHHPIWMFVLSCSFLRWWYKNKKCMFFFHCFI
jgi:hypothetical protein